MMSADTVLVELLRHLSRGEHLLEPGTQLCLQLDEASAMFRAGFAKPAGAPADFGRTPLPAWAIAWRR